VTSSRSSRAPGWGPFVPVETPLIDAWRTSNRVTLYLIENVPPGLWPRPIPGAPRKTVRSSGRAPAQQPLLVDSADSEDATASPPRPWWTAIASRPRRCRGRCRRAAKASCA
jgi:hypothetical protein